ncbi:MAG TPA: ABC transporter permease subunit [Saprospiraceae bacterium]|nr:ABC transporter permease subunit [Saprospiraceae bacterium]
MQKIIKYSFFDLIRSRWALFYGIFFLLFTGVLLAFSTDLSKVIISLMNVVLVLCPLIATMFGAMYYYNTSEFRELLLAQPIRRRSIFWGQFIGLSLSLTLSLLVGMGIPFVVYGIFASAQIWNFIILIGIGIALSMIFAALAYLIAMVNTNQIRGFGIAILVWLFFALIYDGIFLILLSVFSAYPLDSASLAGSLLNPIDLARILILLKLDISALMGYTSAVFNKFFGTVSGMLISAIVLGLWIVIPGILIQRVSARRDF